MKSMHVMRRFGAVVLAAGLLALGLAGCGSMTARSEARIQDVQQQEFKAEESLAKVGPIVSRTSAAWLLGDSVQVAQPLPSILQNAIEWVPSTKVTLLDVAAYVTRKTGLVVDTTEVNSLDVGVNSLPAASATPSGTAGGMMLPPPSQVFNNTSRNGGQTTALPAFSLAYSGTVAGLLDFSANHSGVSWRFSEGKTVFFRTLTKTIYIPAIARKSAGNSTISANTQSNTSNSGGGTAVSTTSVGANSSTGASTSTADYSVDVWSTIQKTAEAIAGTGTGAPAKVVADPNLSSVTVTGTPAQVRNVEEWTKGLIENLSQQVLITATVYSINADDEDNYQWNPSIMASRLSSKYSFGLVGAQGPAITSGQTPMDLTAGILSSSNSTLSGSQLAFQAISTLGKASQQVRQSVITLNGQPAPMQVASQVGYLASSGTNLTANVGSTTTLTPGTVTTGFTAMFLPKIVNGKIYLQMTMTNSTLKSINTVTSGTGSNQGSIQTPNIDSNTFQQSVALTPGDALLLTGLQTDNASVNRNGVGTPYNALLGGGTDTSNKKTLVSIVITARIL